MTKPNKKVFTHINPSITIRKLKKALTDLDDKRRYQYGSATNTGAHTVTIGYQQLTEWIFLVNVLEDSLKLMEFKK